MIQDKEAALICTTKDSRRTLLHGDAVSEFDDYLGRQHRLVLVAEKEVLVRLLIRVCQVGEFWIIGGNINSDEVIPSVLQILEPHNEVHMQSTPFLKLKSVEIRCNILVGL